MHERAAAPIRGRRLASADVVILGGGLAGLACAVGLADSGLDIVLVERSGELGGRARSWVHAPSGDEVDIGPHVVHSEYANFLALLERLGTRHLIRWQPEKLITIATRPPTLLRHRGMPPPLSLLPDLVRQSGLSMRDLWSNNGPTWRALKFGEEDVPELDRIAALDYLRACGVTEPMIDWFWRFACMAVMNVPLEECSAAALIRVHAQLIGRRGIHFGFPKAGLSQLYVGQAERLVRIAGGEVWRGVAAVGLAPGADAHEVSLADGRRVAARYCVCALPPQDLHALAPQVAETGYFTPSPYIATYLWLDLKLSEERFWALPWTPRRLNYDFYDLSNIREGWEGRPSVVACNLIYSDRVAAMDERALAEAAFAELCEYQPWAAAATLLHSDVHRIPMAITCPRPGTEGKRPPVQTSTPRLFLAGDWTRTGLPSSMESAVCSGFLAAEEIWAGIGRPRRLAVAPRPTDGIAGLVRAATKAVRHARRNAGPLLA